MQQAWKVRTLAVCSAAIVGAMILISADTAEARPNYLKGFIEKYPALADQAKETKCGICHPETDKKIRNHYAKDLMGVLGDKNIKDAEKIKDSLTKTEKMDSAIEGKTYGDLIKAGKLPSATE